MKRLTLAGASLAIVLFATQFAQADEVDDYIKSQMEQHRIPGVALEIIRDGKAVKTGAYGLANLELKAPVKRETVFEIGSITKTFTGIMLGEMVNEGLLKLDTPAQDCLPQGVTMPSYEGRAIALLDLATHTSGLPEVPDDFESVPGYCFLTPFASYTVDEMYAFLSRYELTRKPGTQYEYSNLGEGLLGNILALKDGKTYEQLVIARICTPCATFVAYTPFGLFKTK